jgi:hypothetical protein
MRLENPRDRQRVARRLQHHAIRRRQAAREQLKLLTARRHTTREPRRPALADRHLTEVAMNIHPDRPQLPHLQLAHRRQHGEAVGERHLRIRARGAPGQVAGAASYTIGLAAHKTALGLPNRVLPEPRPGTPATLKTAPDAHPALQEHIFMPVHHSMGRDPRFLRGRVFGFQREVHRGQTFARASLVGAALENCTEIVHDGLRGRRGGDALPRTSPTQEPIMTRQTAEIVLTTASTCTPRGFRLMYCPGERQFPGVSVSLARRARRPGVRDWRCARREAAAGSAADDEVADESHTLRGQLWLRGELGVVQST